MRAHGKADTKSNSVLGKNYMINSQQKLTEKEINIQKNMPLTKIMTKELKTLGKIS